MTLTANSDLQRLLNSIVLPGLPHTIGELCKVAVQPSDSGRACVEIELGFPAGRLFQEIESAVRDALATVGPSNEFDVRLSCRIRSHGVQRNLKPLENVKNMIAVASGKGGVGKSTTAVNLALALADDGAAVGILDADIYGPSQPLMMGLTGERPISEDGKSMNPLTSHGVQVMSIGFLIDPDQPMVWRGPMVTSALKEIEAHARSVSSSPRPKTHSD